MTLSMLHHSPVAAPTPSNMFEALREIVGELAGGRPLEASLGVVLESLRAAVGAMETSIWLPSGSELVRAWGAGAAVTTAADAQAMLSSGSLQSATHSATKIELGAQRVGVLSVRHGSALESEEWLLVSAVADVLSIELSHAEQSRRLTNEVDMRTAAINRARRFTDSIIDTLPVGLYVVDREYRIRAWNRKPEAGTQGVSREEALGQTIFEVFSRQPMDVLRREIDEVFNTGRIQEYQMESLATGELRTHRISRIPMRLGGSVVTHVLTIGEDVTDRREAHTRFAHAEKLAAIGQLAAGVMHEINNPLATIAAITESLELKIGDAETAGAVLSPDVREYLHLIENEVARCTQIADGLLDFSRRRQSLHERTDINTVVEKALLLLKHHGRFKTIHVIRELGAGIPCVPNADSEQLAQVFLALLLNAMDAMQGRPGHLTIRTRAGTGDAGTVIAEVSDQGHGIPRSDYHKVFEPFYTTKEAGKGTGLGLAICYAIVQEHGGTIEVDSTVGSGSTFRITLPGVCE